jgi:hypothetical protein
MAVRSASTELAGVAMNKHDVRYATGEEIHAGDRIMHAGQPARIGAVLSRSEYTPEFSEERWAMYREGFIVQEDNGQVFMYEHANEDIELVSSERVET